MKQDKSSVELADVFRMHAVEYCRKNQLTPEQYKIIHAVQNCRTAALGGRVEQCGQCQKTYTLYNSCRNRHCPKCQSLQTNRWREKRRAELLPVEYFHLVLTLPHELNHLIQYNKRLLYGLLFKAAWETIKTLGKDPRRLNGLMGMIAILHTWGQNLSLHNHLHCIVPGGALTTQQRWKKCKKGYLFPVKVISRIFRGIYISHLRRLYHDNQLKIPPKECLEDLFNALMKKDWVTYAKEPFTGPEKLLDYLGRYTHKIAILNNRILSCDKTSVRFQWRDYADGNKSKVMALAPNEFIRRFLSHAVPENFMRIRFFGFLASACKSKKIALIREKLSYQATVTKAEKDTVTIMIELAGIDITLCPACKKGRLHVIKKLPNKFGCTMFDTS